MSADELIDTTEMYLKVIYELEEDGVTPLRARIVERLGHSGPTVSQTIARMERDGLVMVRADRRLDLTERGRALVADVMRKHRLAELLLLHVIGLQRNEVHREACRWEHVMSVAVEERLKQILGQPETDPFGNPIPGMGAHDSQEISVETLVRDDREHEGRLVRIGEPIQADQDLLSNFEAAQLRPGQRIRVVKQDNGYRLCAVLPAGHDPAEQICVWIEDVYASHLFLVAE